MTEPDPLRVERYAVADVDFTTLPAPVAFADTVVEQPVSWDGPGLGGWEGPASGGDDGGGD
jgi:hypothetical protein